MLRSLLWIMGAAVAIFFISVPRAYAYLDPGTGSIILQLILGGIGGGLLIIKLYWARLKNLFSGREKSRK